jgi:HAD superfamily hydrolase (TIGR01509 family)
MIDRQKYLEGVQLFIFDLDGTLRRFHPSSHEAVIAYAGEQGFTFDADAQRRGLLWSHTYWADDEQIRADRKRLGEADFWGHFVGHYLQEMGMPQGKLAPAVEVIKRRFVDDFKPEGRLIPGAKEILWHLRSQQFIVGLLSNRKEPLTGIAIELGIIEHFHFTIAAGQVGSWKPDPGIFRQALTMAGGVSPQKAVYIGDNYYTDAIGAHKAGMRSVLLDEHGIYAHVAGDCLLVRELTELKNYLT